MSATPDPSGTWGACRFCGVAVPPRASRCEICGAGDPIAARDVARAPRKVRLRLRLTAALRTAIVVVVVLGLAYAVIPAVLSGPPVLTGDPLTTQGGYEIGPGNFTVIYGEITGGDYVIGNFSTYAPAGTNIGLAVYNSTAWAQFRNGSLPVPAWSAGPSADARIVYSAPVTDTYYFVFTNPYPAASSLTIGVYVATQYESNVGNSGFA